MAGQQVYNDVLDFLAKTCFVNRVAQIFGSMPSRVSGEPASDVSYDVVAKHWPPP